MIRNVSSGDLGLDVILGGGWRLVERLPGLESATVLLRGGPGTGKSLLAVDVALALAEALKGDVVVACVEMLPSEFIALIEAGRAELALQHRDGPVLENPRVHLLPMADRAPVATEPRVFVGLAPELNAEAPDIVGALEQMREDVRSVEGKPAVYILDSLIGGYGLGAQMPRLNIDAAMKFAAQEGAALVMCEETIGDAPSGWDFTADTVLGLDQSLHTGREIVVRKHRYGRSAPGAHKLEINGWSMPRVGPRPGAWYGGWHNLRETFGSRGWHFINGHFDGSLRWLAEVAPDGLMKDQIYPADFAYVCASNYRVARLLACGLVPISKVSHRDNSQDGADSDGDLIFHFEPLGSHSEGWSTAGISMKTVPVVAGPNFGIAYMVAGLAEEIFRESRRLKFRRIILGDLATLTNTSEQVDWAEGIAAFVQLVSGSGWNIPVIAFHTHERPVDNDALAVLRHRADLSIIARDMGNTWVKGEVTSRPNAGFETVTWNPGKLFGTWPTSIERLEKTFLLGHGRR